MVDSCPKGSQPQDHGGTATFGRSAAGEAGATGAVLCLDPWQGQQRLHSWLIGRSRVSHIDGESYTEHAHTFRLIEFD